MRTAEWLRTHYKRQGSLSQAYLSLFNDQRLLFCFNFYQVRSQFASFLFCLTSFSHRIYHSLFIHSSCHPGYLISAKRYFAQTRRIRVRFEAILMEGARNLDSLFKAEACRVESSSPA